MANLHLVTGYAGVEHITSDDQGSFNAAIMGTGQFVLERGNQFAALIISNNEVKVSDGDALMQGRHIRMKENTYVNLNFDNGLQGYNRIDLIVIRYTKDSTTDIETANLIVIKGTSVEGDPAVPDHMVGDLINEHDLVNDLVLYKVPFAGLNIQPLEAVFDTVPTWETLKNRVIENITTKFDAFVAEAMKQIRDAEKPIISNIDDMLLIENYGEYAADAKTTGEAITQLYSGIGGFSPVIDETGKITGYKTTIGGADTVFPFNEIDKSRLISALANSGLGLTMQNTPEQIYAALQNKFNKRFSYNINFSHSKNSTVVYVNIDGKASFSVTASVYGQYFSGSTTIQETGFSVVLKVESLDTLYIRVIASIDGVVVAEKQFVPHDSNLSYAYNTTINLSYSE